MLKYMTAYVEISDSICWNIWQCTLKYMTVYGKYVTMYVEIYDSVRRNIWQCMLK